MNFDAVKFHIGQKVFSTLNAERVGIISGIVFRATGVTYCVTWDNTLTELSHFDFELSEEKLLSGSYST